MKSLRRTFLAVSMAAWLPLAWAQEAPKPADADAEKQQREQVQKEVEEAVEALRGYTIERRKEAIDRARKSLAEADRRIERLDSQMNERSARANAVARERSREAMAELRRLRIDTAEWSGSLRHSSRDVWEEVKSGYIESYRRLADELQKVRAQFDRDQTGEPPPDPKQADSEEQEKRER